MLQETKKKKLTKEQNAKETFPMFLFWLLFLLLSSRKQQAAI